MIYVILDLKSSFRNKMKLNFKGRFEKDYIFLKLIYYFKSSQMPVTTDPYWENLVFNIFVFLVIQESMIV